MASWQEVVDAAPEFARAVQALFDAGRHKTLATLRKDGAPRISGIEVSFKDGEVWFGSMKDARKAVDLRRDPRLALHSPSPDPGDDPLAWPGDAKLAGRTVEIDDPKRLKAMGGAGEGHIYRIDISEVVLTRVGGMDHLVVELWRPGHGLKSTKRYN